MLETLKEGSIFTDVMHEHWRHQLFKYDIVSFWGAFDSVSWLRCFIEFSQHADCHCLSDRPKGEFALWIAG